MSVNSLGVMELTVLTSIADIVPLNKRGAYQGYMGASYAISGALGPVLGGILTEKATWRVSTFSPLIPC